MSPGAEKRRRSRGRFALRCGCKDSKSVSVSVPVSVSASDTSDKSTPRRARESSSADALTLTSPSSSCWEEDGAEKMESSASTPSFSGLLRQLSALEQNVMAWGPPPPPGKEKPPLRLGGGEGGGRLEESVAVVKDTDDPLGDFRRSMLQMIVEKEIVGGEELRELLRRFLSLNSPEHHELILRAFAGIWEEVFSGYENTPDLCARHAGR